MKTEELKKLSMEVDMVFLEKDVAPSDIVAVMSFTLAKALYAIGISRELLMDAMSAVSDDVATCYDAISEIMNYDDETELN